jgi:hypothetical protein
MLGGNTLLVQSPEAMNFVLFAARMKDGPASEAVHKMRAFWRVQ